MVYTCIVRNCHTASKFTHHCFPKTENEFQLWKNAIKLFKVDNISDSELKKSRVCYNHFLETDYNNFYKYRRLNPGSVPSQNLPILTQNHDIQESIQKNEFNSSLQVLRIKDDYTTNIEWSNKCVACLKDEVQMENISSLSILSGFKELLEYLEIEDFENENLFHNVCQNCVIQMHSMLNFKKQCEESKKKLKLLTPTASAEKIQTSIVLEDQSEIVQNKIEQTTSSVHSSIKFKDQLFTPTSLPKTTMYVKEELHIDPHVKIEQDFDSTPLKEICVTCKETYKDEIWLKRHQILVHGLNDCIKECSECKLYYNYEKYEYLLKFHKDNHHENICGVCNLNFQTIFHLAKHRILHACNNRIDTKMEKKLGKISCAQCNEVFASFRTLRTHIGRIHNTNRAKKFCAICKRSVFHLKEHLKSHRKGTRRISIPQNKKIYSCPRDALCVYCGKFYGRSSLKSHIIAVHFGIKNYECSYCKRMFSTATTRTSHVKSVHLKLKRFPCSQCNIKCKSRQHLELHMLKHTGERPFKCPYCDLSLRGNLKRHIRVVHGSKI